MQPVCSVPSITKGAIWNPVGFNPISACFNLIFRAPFQPVDRSTAFRRFTQQPKLPGVELENARSTHPGAG
jgi:hypothetical protein